MSKLFSFTNEEKQAVGQAVKDAEKNTSGEIVPYIVDKSDHYRETPMYMALTAAVFMVIMLNILAQLWLLPFKFDTLNFSLLIIGFMIAVYLLSAYIPVIKRLLISPRRMDNMVNRRALQAFVEEEVFNTRDRSGVLLFVSEFEHRVELIADSGINAKVDQDEWKKIVDNLIAGIKKKQTAGAMVAAIEACGEKLTKAGFDIKPDDPNELSDSLRIDELKDDK